MQIRRAQKKDIDDVLRLLSQVLEIHAALRPDLFVSGTTKYSADDLRKIFEDDTKPVYVAVSDPDPENGKAEGAFLGYAFCEVKEPVRAENMVPVRSLYLDDLCVDEAARHLHVGEALFRHVCGEAVKAGCHDVHLNVWEGNDARIFYERMGMKVRKTTMELVL